MATDHRSSFADANPAGFLALDFNDRAQAVDRIRRLARDHPISAVFGIDDRTAVLAAVLARALDLPGNQVGAVEAAADKHLQRRLLQAAGVRVPAYAVYALDADAASVARSVPYPVVLKPLALSASRGVIRANAPDEFVEAQRRLAAILGAARAEGAADTDRFLVEAFVSGPEFALEGLLVDGRLHVLALFDKPDPLEGPFFEETIYVTPSRLPAPAQRTLEDCAARAARALGLTRGPVHIELRYTGKGAWLIELAARPIGGKCGQILRFEPHASRSLEEVLLQHALNRGVEVPAREPTAAAVMMIPTPRRGRFVEARGVEAARRISSVTDVIITVPPGHDVIPLPEGSRYLGFVFARAARPAEAECAVRNAFEALELVIE